MNLPNVWGNKLVWFFNWSDKEFTYPWGKENYTFKPKQRVQFQEGLAFHFAKHLAEFVFNTGGSDGRGVKYNMAELELAIKKGLIYEDGIEAVSEEQLQMRAAMNKSNAEMEKESKESLMVSETKTEEAPKKRAGRPKKKAEEVKPVSSDLDGFEGK